MLSQLCKWDDVLYLSIEEIQDLSVANTDMIVIVTEI